MSYSEKSLLLRATLQKIRDACQFVRETARSAGMSDDGIFQCDLSVEEIMTNIIEHGYKHQATTEIIEVVCRYDQDIFIIRIIDSAPPFDPLTLANPNTSPNINDLDDLKAGGVGVHFVKQFMDEVSYEYHDGKNHFTMKRHIP